MFWNTKVAQETVICTNKEANEADFDEAVYRHISAVAQQTKQALPLLVQEDFIMYVTGNVHPDRQSLWNETSL